jgi:Holliday junction DNA helicase RuvA
MIGQLRGILIEKQPPFLMMDVQGVGYWLQAPLSTFFVLPEVGQMLTLRTHFIVREDAQLLFGFSSTEECALFQEVIKINGVGPKIALTLLSGLTPQEFYDVIMSQNVALLQRIPGIGAKTAQRILVEMQGRLPKLSVKSEGGSIPVADPKQEAISALVSLGYRAQEAQGTIAKIKTDSLSCEQIIKEALQRLAKV